MYAQDVCFYMYTQLSFVILTPAPATNRVSVGLSPTGHPPGRRGVGQGDVTQELLSSCITTQEFLQFHREKAHPVDLTHPAF